MKMAISSPAVCSLSGFLYVIGGSFFNQEDVIDLVQVYTPSSDTWKEIATLLQPRSGAGACALNGKIYALGGRDSFGELDQVECLDVASNSSGNKWQMCPAMIEKRYKPGVSILNNQLYACGGQKSTGNYNDSIEAFNFDTQQWTIISYMTTGRSNLSCATLKLKNPMIENADEINNEKNNTSF
jgi:influenza virus NS1A-binding protein